MRHLLTITLTSLGLPAFAQSWSGTGFDDGVWFIGAAISANSEVILACGGRSAQNRPFEDSEYTEPTLTERDIINFALDPAPWGWPAAESLADIAIVIDGQSYSLPPLPFSDFDGAYAAGVDINDPIFAALRAGSSAAITQNGATIQSFGLRGSSAAIRTMAQACVAGWANQPREPVVWSSATVREVAEDFCNGPAKVDFDWVTIQDLDGDGLQDLLLDIGAVECTEEEFPMSRGAGMCGASHCSQFVYLSMATTSEPEEFLSIGSRTFTDAEGRTIIAGSAGLGECQPVDPENGCEYRFDPAGGTLDYLGIFSRIAP